MKGARRISFSCFETDLKKLLIFVSPDLKLVLDLPFQSLFLLLCLFFSQKIPRIYALAHFVYDFFLTVLSLVMVVSSGWILRKNVIFGVLFYVCY